MDLQIQHKYLSKANQLMAQTNNQLAEVYATLGDWQQATIFCHKVLKAIQCTYSSSSTAVAYQKLKLADLLKVQGHRPLAHEQTAAKRILQLHFGDSA
jgi:hypothetical protein